MSQSDTTDPRLGKRDAKTIAEEAIAELEGEGYEVEGRKKTAPPTDDEAGKDAPGDKKPEGDGEADKTPTDPAKPPVDKKPDAGDDDVETIPLWKHRMELKRQKTQIEEDLAAEAEKQKQRDLDNKKPTDKAPTDDEIEKRRAKLRERFPELEDDALDDLAYVAGSKASAELIGRLERLEKLEETRLNQIEATEFDRHFEAELVPLVKAEYPGLSDRQLAEVKERMQKLAYSEPYLALSLDKIWKVEDEFRTLVPKNRKTAEPSRGGTDRGDTLDFDKVTDEDLAQMDDKTFDLFLAHKKAKSKKS